MKELAKIIYEAPQLETDVQKSEDQAVKTLDRVAKMRMQALLKGHVLTFAPRIEDGAEKLFEEPKREKRRGLPIWKIKDLIFESALRPFRR